MQIENENISRRGFLSLLGAAVAGFAAFGNPCSSWAVTSKKFSIIYKLSGGQNPKSQVNFVAAGKSLSVKKLKKPTRKGYAFKCWCTNEKRTKKAKKVYGLGNTKRRTLYAKWKAKQYSIQYHLNGGVQPVGQNYHFTIEEDKDLLIPSNGDLRFAGWYREGSFVNRVGRVPKGTTGTYRVYAKWREVTTWDEALPGLLARAKDRAEAVKGHGETFVFITDLHLDRNAGNAPQIISRVFDEMQPERVVCGGDLISFNRDKASNLARIDAWVDEMSFAPLYLVRGNHDMNEYMTSGAQKAPFDDQEFTERFLNEGGLPWEQSNNNGYKQWLEDVGIHAESSRTPYAYCIDNQDQKIRYIVMDTGSPLDCVMESSQITWMKERVLELGRGWTVLVIVHMLFTSKKPYSGNLNLALNTNGKMVVKALDELYGKCCASIAGVLAGHNHRDYYEFSEKGYPLISVECDAYKPDAKYAVIEERYQLGSCTSRRLGTVEDQAFDVVSIDTAAKKIYLTRFGFGEDREFGY